MKNKKCEKCETENENNAKFCLKCGEPFKKQRFNFKGLVIGLIVVLIIATLMSVITNNIRGPSGETSSYGDITTTDPIINQIDENTASISTFVKNDGSAVYKNVVVVLELYDSNWNSVGSTSGTELPVLRPGEVTPLVIDIEDPEGNIAYAKCKIVRANKA